MKLFFLYVILISSTSFAAVDNNTSLDLSTCAMGTGAVYPGNIGGGVGGLAGGASGGYPGAMTNSNPNSGYGYDPSLGAGFNPGMMQPGDFAPGGFNPNLNAGYLGAAPQRRSSDCPFVDDKASENQDLTAVQSYVQALAAEEGNAQKTCPEIAQAASAAKASLGATVRNNLQIDFPSIQSGLPTCQNYEYVLTLERQSFSSGAFVTSYTSPYAQNCPSNASSSECIERVYAERLACAARICRDNAATLRDNAQNQIYRDAIMNISSTVNGLISVMGSTKGCGNGELVNSILSTSLSTLSALGSMATATPYGGSIIALTGNMVNSLVNNFFENKSARNAWATIQKESDRQKLQCIYLTSVRNALDCDQFVLGDAMKSTTVASGPACQSLPEISEAAMALVTIRNLASAMAAEFNQGTEVNPQLLDKLDELMNSKIGDRSYKEFLGGLAKDLRALRSNRSEANSHAKVIEQFLNQYELLDKALTEGSDFSGNELRSTLLNLKSGEASQTASGLLTNGVTLAGTIRSALALTRSDDFKGISRLEQEYEAGRASQIASQFLQQTIYDKSSAENRNSNTAHDALLSAIQPDLEKRLEEIGNDFKVNSSVSLSDKALSAAEYLVNTCTLNLGAFYFKPDNNPGDSINKIKDPGNTFKKMCEPVFCSGVVERPPVNPSPADLRRYQCRLIGSYNAHQAALRANPRLKPKSACSK